MTGSQICRSWFGGTRPTGPRTCILLTTGSSHFALDIRWNEGEEENRLAPPTAFLPLRPNVRINNSFSFASSSPSFSLNSVGELERKKKVEWEMGRRDESEGGEERKRERKKEKRRTLTRPPTPTWFDSFWLKTLTSLGSSLLSPSIHLFLPSPLSI